MKERGYPGTFEPGNLFLFLASLAIMGTEANTFRLGTLLHFLSVFAWRNPFPCFKTRAEITLG